MKKNIPIKERTPYGTLYQNEPGSWFYFRYQANGRRHNEGLGTKDYAEAKKIINTKYAERVQKDRLGLNAPEAIKLSIGDAWRKYCESPERATPATVSEAQSYESTWNDFVLFMGNSRILLRDITYQDANRYANHLREDRNYAVDTHNRKIKRIRKVFKALHNYWTGTNPFASSTLLRKGREERDLGIRRLGFTVEQEQKILETLEDPKKKVKNKAEIRVIFYLGIFTGQRLKDCVLARWNNIDLIQKQMEIEQNKTGKVVSLPIAPQLEAVLREALAWRQSDDYVCPLVAHRYNQTDKNGKNTGNNLVNIDVMRVIRWAGIEPSVKTEGRDKSISVYGFHSLRAFGTGRTAESLASDAIWATARTPSVHRHAHPCAKLEKPVVLISVRVPRVVVEGSVGLNISSAICGARLRYFSEAFVESKGRLSVRRANVVAIHEFVQPVSTLQGPHPESDALLKNSQSL